MTRDRTQPFDPRQSMAEGEKFEIFHYRDGRLDRVSVHHHDFYEVYLFLEGNVEFTVEGRCWRLAPGDLLLISPLELHQLRARAPREPYERMVLWLAPSCLAGLSTPETSLTRCFDRSWSGHTNLLRLGEEGGGQVRALLEELLREVEERRYGWDAAARGLLLRLLTQVNRLALDHPPAQEAEDRGETQIRQVLDYIDGHYQEELSLDRLAGQFFISKYHLSHQFQRLVGASVYRYIIKKRLVIAKQLLSAGVPPTEVYRNCGFRDYSNFYRTFRAEYGMSPSQFAAARRGGQPRTFVAPPD